MSQELLNILPNFDFEERHSIQNIRAPATTILQEVVNFDSRLDPWMNKLIQMREFPGRVLMAFSKKNAIPPQRERFGLEDFTLLKQTDTEIAYGLMGSLWKINYGLSPCRDLADFQQQKTGCRLLLSFHITPSQDGLHRLETITRVACMDKMTRLKFTPYWYLIRLCSGFIRKKILKQVKHFSELHA